MDDLIDKFVNLQISTEQLKTAISYDAHLSYHLLHYLNQAQIDLSHPVESIQQATQLLKDPQLEAWANNTYCSGSYSHSVDDLTTKALTRAKFCESTAKDLNSHNINSFYSVGLLSVLDIGMKRPINNILEALPLNEDLNKAIAQFNGVMGETLHACLKLENEDWDHIEFPYLSKAALNMNYRNAFQWAEDIARNLHI